VEIRRDILVRMAGKDEVQDFMLSGGEGWLTRCAATLRKSAIVNAACSSADLTEPSNYLARKRLFDEVDNASPHRLHGRP